MLGVGEALAVFTVVYLAALVGVLMAFGFWAAHDAVLKIRQHRAEKRLSARLRREDLSISRHYAEDPNPWDEHNDLDLYYERMGGYRGRKIR